MSLLCKLLQLLSILTKSQGTALRSLFISSCSKWQGGDHDIYLLSATMLSCSVEIALKLSKCSNINGSKWCSGDRNSGSIPLRSQSTAASIVVTQVSWLICMTLAVSGKHYFGDWISVNTVNRVSIVPMKMKSSRGI